jgi:ankyrin repeat protein
VNRPGAGGVTAAHRAADAGQVDVLRMLVDSGADLAAADIQFAATPLGWAEYFGQEDAAAYLRGV